MQDKIIEADNKTTSEDIKNCIDFNKSKEIIKFVSKDKLYDEVLR